MQQSWIRRTESQCARIEALKAAENTNLAAEALQGTQAAYERVKQGQSEEQYARFAASLDDVNKSVVLQNSWQGGTANGEEGAGCRVLLTCLRGEMCVLKEFQDHDMFLDELMHHADANDLTKPARRAYSFAKSFIVMELGPRKDLECELKSLLVSTMQPHRLRLTLAGWLHDIVHATLLLNEGGAAHCDLKLRNVSQTVVQEFSGRGAMRVGQEARRVALLDFASCKNHGNRHASFPRNVLNITPGYAPPESLKPIGATVSPATDYYALARIVLQLFIVGPWMDDCEYYMGTWETLRALLGDVAIEAELRNAYTLRCGLSESVVLIGLLLAMLLQGPQDRLRELSWEAVHHLVGRLLHLVSLASDEATVEEMAAAHRLKQQLLLQLATTPVAKSVQPPELIKIARKSYAEAAAASRALDCALQQKEKLTGTPSTLDRLLESVSRTTDVELVDDEDADAMDAAFQIGPTDIPTSLDFYDIRHEEHMENWASFLNDTPDACRAKLLYVTAPFEDNQSCMERLSFVQQCQCQWEGRSWGQLAEMHKLYCSDEDEEEEEEEEEEEGEAAAAAGGGTHPQLAAVGGSCGAHSPRSSSSSSGGDVADLSRQLDRVVLEAEEQEVMAQPPGPPPPLPQRGRSAHADGTAIAAAPLLGATSLEDCVLGQSQQAAAADPPALLLTQAAKLATRGIGKGGGSTKRKKQGKELWLCSQGSYSWQTKTSTSRLDLNRLFLLHEDWGREAIVLNSFTQQLLDRLAPHTAGLRHVYLYLPLLECGRFLSVPLAEQWAAERLLQPDMRVLLIATKPFALIVHAEKVKTQWRKHYCSRPLRAGLGQYGLQPCSDNQPGRGGIVAEGENSEAHQYTAFGASLWHDSLRQLLSSMEVVGQLPAYWSSREPETLDASDRWLAHSHLVPSSPK